MMSSELARIRNNGRRPEWTRKFPAQALRDMSSVRCAEFSREAWVMGRFSSSEDNVLFLGGNLGCVGVIDARYANETEDNASDGVKHLFRAHMGVVVDMCDVPSKPHQIATVSGDTTVRVWDLNHLGNESHELARPIATFTGHEGTVRAISFCPNNPFVFVTSGRDGVLNRWDLRAKPVPCCEGAVGLVHPIAVYPNIHELPPPTKGVSIRRKAPLAGPSVTSVVYVDDNHVVTGSQMSKTGLRMWDMRRVPSSGVPIAPVRTYQVPVDKGVTCLSLDRFRSSIFASLTDSKIYEFSLATESTRHVRSYTGAKICSFYAQIAVSPVSDHLLCGSTDGVALIWDLQEANSDYIHSYGIGLSRKQPAPSLHPSWQFAGLRAEVSSLGWSCDGNYIFALDDFDFRVFDRTRPFVDRTDPNNIQRVNYSIQEYRLLREQERIEPIELSEGPRKSRSSLATPVPPSLRQYTSPTKTPSRANKRPLPIQSPFKNTRTPNSKSPRTPRAKISRFDISPVLPPLAPLSPSQLENSPIRALKTLSKTPRKRTPRKPKNAFHAKYPTWNLPNIRYDRYIERLRMEELAKRRAETFGDDKSENTANGKGSVEGWLRRPQTSKKMTPKRLSRMRVPSLTEFGDPVCSHMVTEEERLEASSPRKVVIRTPAKDPITPVPRPPSATLKGRTPQSVGRKSSRNILDYFPKTPK